MTLGVLFYDIVLMSLYVVTITVAFFTYKIKKTDTALVVALLFVVFFIDHIIISMTEIIPSFGAAYEKIFLTVPSAKTLVYVA